MNEFIREGFHSLTHKRYKAEKAIFKCVYRDLIPCDLYKIILEYSHIDDICLDPEYFKKRKFEYCGLIGKGIFIENNDEEYANTGPNISIFIKRDMRCEFPPNCVNSCIPSDWVRFDNPIITLFSFILNDHSHPLTARMRKDEGAFYKIPPCDELMANALSICFASQLLIWQSPRPK